MRFGSSAKAARKGTRDSPADRTAYPGVLGSGQARGRPGEPLVPAGARQPGRTGRAPTSHPGHDSSMLRKYAKQIGLARGSSAHSMRATFITTALENGAGLEDVQLAAGHDYPRQRSSTIDEGTTRRRARASLRIIEAERKRREVCRASLGLLYSLSVWC